MKYIYECASQLVNKINKFLFIRLAARLMTPFSVSMKIAFFKENDEIIIVVAGHLFLIVEVNSFSIQIKNKVFLFIVYNFYCLKMIISTTLKFTFSLQNNNFLVMKK